MHTEFCRLVGVEAPIVQAPMGGASCPELAAAVSNAGGLGMLALSWHPPEAVRHEIRRTRELTDKPFGVNLVLAFPQEERVAVLLEEKVPVISFFWGDPAPFIEPVHQAGSLVASTVATAEQAAREVEAGVDVVVAQGWEAGGHVLGQVATLPLVRSVVEVAGSTPVVAAGGIADGRSIAAVLALGASAAWIGTRFLASEEAAIHSRYREMLLAADGADTVHTGLFDGNWPDAPHRVLRNSTYAAWEAVGRPAPGLRPDEGQVLARDGRRELRRYDSATPGKLSQGDIEALSLWAGQGVGLVREVKPAGQIVRELVAEAEAAVRGLTAVL